MPQGGREKSLRSPAPSLLWPSARPSSASRPAIVLASNQSSSSPGQIHQCTNFLTSAATRDPLAVKTPTQSTPPPSAACLPRHHRPARISPTLRLVIGKHEPIRPRKLRLREVDHLAEPTAPPRLHPPRPHHAHTKASVCCCWCLATTGRPHFPTGPTRPRTARTNHRRRKAAVQKSRPSRRAHRHRKVHRHKRHVRRRVHVVFEVFCEAQTAGGRPIG